MKTSHDLNRRRCLGAVLLVVLGLTSAAMAVPATYYVDTIGASAAVNNSLFFQDTPPGSTGTGTFAPFLAVHHHGNAITEQGYNHDLTVGMGGPVFDEDLSKTHSLTLGAVPIFKHDGTDYYEFILDLDEPNNSNRKIDLTELQIITAANPNLIVTSFTGTLLNYPGILRYDLDGIGDSTVVFDGSLSPGNGKRDVTLLVPTSDFSGASANDYIVFYTQFNRTDGSFEEWGHMIGSASTPPPPPPANSIPEPVTAGLSLLGLVAVGLTASRRRR